MQLTNGSRGDEIMEGDEVDTYCLEVTNGRNTSPNPSVILGKGYPKRVKTKEPKPTRSVSVVCALAMSGLTAEPRLTSMEVAQNQVRAEKALEIVTKKTQKYRIMHH